MTTNKNKTFDFGNNTSLAKEFLHILSRMGWDINPSVSPNDRVLKLYRVRIRPEDSLAQTLRKEFLSEESITLNERTFAQCVYEAGQVYKVDDTVEAGKWYRVFTSSKGIHKKDEMLVYCDSTKAIPHISGYGFNLSGNFVKSEDGLGNYDDYVCIEATDIEVFYALQTEALRRYEDGDIIKPPSKINVGGNDNFKYKAFDIFMTTESDGYRLFCNGGLQLFKCGDWATVSEDDEVVMFGHKVPVGLATELRDSNLGRIKSEIDNALSKQ